MVQTAADIEREVREADAGRVKALLESDLAALEALLGDDLTYVHSSGALDTKTSYIESISSGRARYLAMDMADINVRALADDVAAIDARFEARVLARGNELNLKSRVLMVYARRDGRWQMVAWQSTPIANPA